MNNKKLSSIWNSVKFTWTPRNTKDKTKIWTCRQWCQMPENVPDWYMYKVLSYFHRHLVDLSEAELSAVVGRKQLKLSIFTSNSTNNIHHINISDCKQFRANLFKFGKILIITYVSTINITFISLLYRMQRHINATINKFSILGKC